MQKLIKPSYIPGNFDSFLFIKFFKEDVFRRKFTNGQIYMSNISSFWDKVENSDGVNDSSEGTEVVLQTTEKIVHRLVNSPDGHPYIVSIESDGEDTQPHIVEAELGRGRNSERKIFCLYTLWIDTKNKKFLKISPKLIKDWNYASLITNTEEFLNRILLRTEEKASEIKSKPIYGFVNYLEHKSTSPVTLLAPLDKKKEGYIYQNEFRFSFEFLNKFGPYEDFYIQVDDICYNLDVNDLIQADEIILNGEVFSVCE